MLGTSCKWNHIYTASCLSLSLPFREQIKKWWKARRVGRKGGEGTMFSCIWFFCCPHSSLNLSLYARTVNAQSKPGKMPFWNPATTCSTSRINPAPHTLPSEFLGNLFFILFCTDMCPSYSLLKASRLPGLQHCGIVG